jgi:hypothetical protein
MQQIHANMEHYIILYQPNLLNILVLLLNFKLSLDIRFVALFEIKIWNDIP